jgi:hypothetical protein
MTKLEIQIHDDIAAVINKIRNINDSGIELIIPEGAVLFDNVLNLRLLEKEANKIDKTLHLNTTDQHGINLIKMINSDDTAGPEIDDDFAHSFHETTTLEEPHYNEPKKRRDFKLIFLGLGRFGKVKSLKTFVIPLAILLALGGGAYAYATRVPKAQVNIIVNSQPLTKSVEIKVIKDASTNTQTKTLKGYQVETLISLKDTAPTTGEKLVGETAKGEVRIFNKTGTERRFREGVTIIHKSTGLVYELAEDVTVPARTENEVTFVITPGEATAKIAATDIGDKYNIDKDLNLEFEDFSKDDFTARTTQKVTGGKSETIKVVTEADRTALSEKLLKQAGENVLKELNNKVVGDRKIISGATSSAVQNAIFSAEIDDEKDEIELTQEILAAGLSFSEKELNELLGEILEDFIPDGFTLSTRDKEIKVEVLGNTDSTVLNTTSADLQVTLKAYVVTKLDEGDIKGKLANKKLDEAQKILGGIKNIKTYELNVAPNVPLLRRMPRDPENITVTISRE